MTAPDIAALEAAILTAAPEDAPPVAEMLAQAQPLDPGPDPVSAGDFAADLTPDLIAPEVWAAQWGALHDMAGGIVQMRTGAPCPLGDQARSDGGQIAAQAAYALFSSTPILRDLFLSPGSSFIGQIFAIGMHGFACVQMVKASTAQAATA